MARLVSKAPTALAEVKDPDRELPWLWVLVKGLNV